MEHIRISGHRSTSCDASDWLHLTATPTFMLMALVTGFGDGHSMDMLCPAAHTMFPLGGMTMMYLLMAVFHATPWLKRGSRWWRCCIGRASSVADGGAGRGGDSR